MNNKDIFYSYLSILGFVAICGLIWFGFGDVPLAARPGKTAKPARPAIEPYLDPYLTYQLIAAHNAERARNEVAAIDPHVYLVLAARRHAEDMARSQSMTHGDLGNGNLAQRVAKTGYHASRAAENVAMGQDNIAYTMRTWMHSAGHRANILGNYQHMGAAVAYDRNGRPYWCAVFGSEAK